MIKHFASVPFRVYVNRFNVLALLFVCDQLARLRVSDVDIVHPVKIFDPIDSMREAVNFILSSEIVISSLCNNLTVSLIGRLFINLRVFRKQLALLVHL